MENSDTAHQIMYVAFDNVMFLIVILTKTFCNKSCIPKDTNSAIIIWKSSFSRKLKMHYSTSSYLESMFGSTQLG